MIIFILLSFIFWRMLLFFIAFIAHQFFTFEPTFPYSDVYLIQSNLPSWLWSFANFDGVHYLGIARSGYSAQFTQVFFPIYPMIIRAINYILPQYHDVLIGIFLSNVFFLAALILFWKLLEGQYTTSEIKWIIIFCLFFPTSFYFGSLYTEGLFLFLTILSFYLAKYHLWFFTALVGGISSATRLNGVFLLPALTVELFKTEKFEFATSSFLKKINFIFIKLIPLFIIMTGIIAYMIYLFINFGDYLYFWHAQSVFGAQRSGTSFILLPQVIWRYIKIITSIPFTNFQFWTALSEFSFSSAALLILILGHVRHIKLSYLIFAWLTILLPTLTGTLSSMPRYVLIAFPIYIYLGSIKSNVIKSFIVTVFIITLLLYTVIFSLGKWIA